jgi:hypothetical protein
VGVEEGRLGRAHARGKIYQVHRRQSDTIFVTASKEKHLPLRTVALFH